MTTDDVKRAHDLINQIRELIDFIEEPIASFSTREWWSGARSENSYATAMSEAHDEARKNAAIFMRRAAEKELVNLRAELRKIGIEP